MAAHRERAQHAHARPRRGYGLPRQGAEKLGYSWACRVVDSRFTGVPQRRRRVILLASRSEDPRTIRGLGLRPRVPGALFEQPKVCITLDDWTRLPSVPTLELRMVAMRQLSCYVRLELADARAGSPRVL
jgi:site-specific DNA-cytosine methylase